MENNNPVNLERWVEDRLATVAPPEGWQPDAAAGLQRLRQPRNSRGANSSKRGRGARAWVGTAVAASCIAALTFPSTRVFAQRCVNACLVETGLVRNIAPTHDLTTAGVIASSQHKAAPDFLTVRAAIQSAKDRKPAPAFRLANASGKAVRLSDYRGKVVLLDFWATECGGCKVEIPFFMEFDHAYRSKGLAVVGVSMDVSYEDLKDAKEGWSRVNPFVREHRLKYPILMGDDPVTKAFDIEALPATYLIDDRGRIAAVYVGVVDKSDVEANVKALLLEH